MFFSLQYAFIKNITFSKEPKNMEILNYLQERSYAKKEGRK